MRILFISLTFVFVAAFSGCEKALPTKEYTLTLNPSNNIDEVHLFGNAQMDLSDPNSPELVGGAGTYEGSNAAIRGIVKFDLGEIPEYASILSARLSLYSNPTPLNGQDGKANSGDNNALYIQRLISQWSANSVTWQNQPLATTEDAVAIPHTVETTKDILDLDVTELIKIMIIEGKNHGFLIRLQEEQPYNFRIFCSSKYTDSSKHPKLEIVYRK